MLKVLMEFRKGILFVRLFGVLNNQTIEIFKVEVKEVIYRVGIKFVVININGLEEINEIGVKEIRSLRNSLIKSKGELFLFGGEIKELKHLVKLENELNVFERVVI